MFEYLFSSSVCLKRWHLYFRILLVIVTVNIIVLTVYFYTTADSGWRDNIRQSKGEMNPHLKMDPSVEIHPSVRTHPHLKMDPSVEIHPSVRTHPHLKMDPSVEIHPSVRTHPHVEMDPSVEIHPSVRTDPHVEMDPDMEIHPSVRTDPHVEMHPDMEMKITQFITWPPLVDGINMKLTCIAERKYDFIKFVAIKWTGKKSIWVKQSEITRQGDSIKVDLLFIPWLESHAGVYTCQLVMKDKNNSTFMLNKDVEVKGEYRGLINARIKSQKFDTSPIIPSKWFPDAYLCGKDDIWQKYADFHASVVSGKQKGKYLIYDCTKKQADICGGYGNRVQSITILLILAMLTKRVFLIQATYPIDINEHLLPNAVQWNYAVPQELNSHFMTLEYHVPSTITALENASLQPYDVIRVQTYLGSFYYIPTLSDNMINNMITTFNLKTHYDVVLLYGCTFNYLFKYQPIVHQSIESRQKEYNLEDGKFVTLHVRSHFHDNGHPIFDPLSLKFPFKPMFECAVIAAKGLSNKLNVSKVPIFLATDDQIVIDFAKKNYKDEDIIFSNAPNFHIDRARYGGAHAKKKYDDGMIGILSDIEIGSRAAVLIRSADSSFSEEMGVINFLRPQNNLHPFDFYNNLNLCQL